MSERVAKRLLALSAMMLAPLVMQAQERTAFAWSNNSNQARTQATVNSSVINTTSRGWYTSDGAGNRAIQFPQNYITGRIGALEYRSFYIFDLSSTLPAVTSVGLGFLNCNTGVPDCGVGTGYNSPNAFETIDIFDFTGSITTLNAGTGGAGAFNDLGSGTLFGSATVSSASNGQVVNFTLNAAGINAFNNARGGQIAVGAAMRLSTVPEPSTYALMAAGLLSIAVISRRRRTA